ncbi:MAG: hypothetical protein JO235_13740 [Chroococcidiopsidaceae cyanobacterium CP_BM_RX_35]|nr:hypothetical protein [Chroococcidiopsidaceae cyanobacterium CP_BM_RX_35]
MPKTPSMPDRYLQELEELERSCGGVFACITPERHKKRWEQKASQLTQQIAAASTVEEKEDLQQQLIELNQREQRKVERLAQVHSLLAPES